MLFLYCLIISNVLAVLGTFLVLSNQRLSIVGFVNSIKSHAKIEIIVGVISTILATLILLSVVPLWVGIFVVCSEVYYSGFAAWKSTTKLSFFLFVGWAMFALISLPEFLF